MKIENHAVHSQKIEAGEVEEKLKTGGSGLQQTAQVGCGDRQKKKEEQDWKLF